MRELPGHLERGATEFLGRDDLVLAQEPWLVAAALDVPVMRLPSDGIEAAREAVRALRPRYMLILAGYPLLERVMVERAGVRLRLISSHPTGSWYRIEP